MYKKRFWQVLVGFVCIVSTGVLATTAVRANPSTTTPRTPSAIDADDGANEVGVEWDTDSGTRPYWFDSANGLYNWMVGSGWAGNFKWGEPLAWEEDFKAAANGGTEHIWIDTVDLALVGTHGSGTFDAFWNANLSSVWFSGMRDDQHLSPGEAYLSYGDGDLEWLAFDSCSVLDNNSIGYWATTFNGLHLLAGFENTMYVNSPGDGNYWGYLMTLNTWCPFCSPLSVTQAWFVGTDWNQPSGVRARVLAEELDNYNDYAWGHGYVSPDYPPDDDFWWWDHVSGTPEPLPLQGPITSLPIFQIVPRTVDENYVQSIGQSLGLSSEVMADPNGMFYYMTGTSGGNATSGTNNLLLIVAAASGSYNYLNLDLLWKDPPQALPASDAEAFQLAMDWLAAHDTLPGSFDFDPDIPPTVAVEGQTSAVPGLPIPPDPDPTIPMNYAISYARTVQLDTEERLSIVGPGSRQNLYIGGNNEIVGMKGGWREVQMVAGSSVPVKSSEEAWNDFLANPGIAVADVPDADLYDLTGNAAPTLAYYEQPSVLGQAELVPVWVFVADLYVQAGASLLTADAKIYVPASAEPTALPQATILSPAPGTVILPGGTVDLSGTAVDGTPPYTYEWSSSVDGVLGTGDTLPGVPLTVNLRAAGQTPNIVTLRVTDANGLTATVSVEVIVNMPTLYLPAVLQP